MRVWAAFLLMFVGVSAHAQSPQPKLTLHSGIKFKGDFWDGLATGPKVTQTGNHYIGLIQSKPNASPLPKDIAVVVNGFVDAYLNHRPDRYASFVLPGPILYLRDKTTTPQNFIPNGFPFEFKGKLTANTPYFLGDKEMHNSPYNVRVEWLVDGELAFISWLWVGDGKVVEMIADGAHVPPMPRSAFDPSDPKTPDYNGH